MAKFLALTSVGLVEALEKELQEIGITKTKAGRGGVFFESNWQGCYKANLCSRLATRIVLPVLDFPAYQPDDIYHNILKHDFTKYMNPNQSLAVDATVRESKLSDQRIVALKTKDAIVDQFREKTGGTRPDVDKKGADMWVLVRVVKNQVSVSIDTSGGPLFKRGYREELVEAPLKEHLAAGLLRLTEWDRKTPVVDLMCGSGTFLIEAAMMAMNVAPGTLRKKFAFQNFASYSKEAFEQVLEEVLAQEKDEPGVVFFGYDIDNKSVKAARTNVRAAGLSDFIKIERKSVDMVTNPLPGQTGMLLANPPYGERLGSVEALKDVYRDMSFALKKEFQGWTFWMLSGEPELSTALKLKSSRKFPVMNGNIECRWLKYEVR